MDLFRGTAAAAVAVSSWLPRSEDLSHHKTPPSGVSGDGHAAMPPWGERGGEGRRAKDAPTNATQPRVRHMD